MGMALGHDAKRPQPPNGSALGFDPACGKPLTVRFAAKDGLLPVRAGSICVMNITPSRRSLLWNGAALLAGTAVELSGSSLLAQPSPPAPAPGVRLGMASYTFRTFDQTRLIEALRKLKVTHLNVKDVHLPMTPVDQIRAKADTFRAAGITLTGAGTISFPKDDDDDIRAKFEYCKTAGIPLIVGSPTHKTIGRVERFVKEYDIRVAIHNHGPEDKEWPSPLDVLAVVKTMDPRIGCCVDVGHCMRTGTDVVAAIERAGPRVLDVHMKDLAQRDAKESQVAVGEGIMPVPAIFAALQRIGYKGFVDLEYEIFPENPLPGVTESFAYMRGVIAGMSSKD